jgi:hypothetical protein
MPGGGRLWRWLQAGAPCAAALGGWCWVALQQGAALIRGGCRANQRPCRPKPLTHPRTLHRAQASALAAFLQDVLVYDPAQRPSARQLLGHPFLLEEAAGPLQA